MTDFDVHQENRIEYILDDLGPVLDRLEDLDRETDYTIKDRDRLIREARAAGATVTTLTRWTRLSRSQVNNILGNRRQ